MEENNIVSLLNQDKHKTVLNEFDSPCLIVHFHQISSYTPLIEAGIVSVVTFGRDSHFFYNPTKFKDLPAAIKAAICFSPIEFLTIKFKPLPHFMTKVEEIIILVSKFGNLSMFLMPMGVATKPSMKKIMMLTLISFDVPCISSASLIHSWKSMSILWQMVRGLYAQNWECLRYGMLRKWWEQWMDDPMLGPEGMLLMYTELPNCMNLRKKSTHQVILTWQKKVPTDGKICNCI